MKSVKSVTNWVPGRQRSVWERSKDSCIFAIFPRTRVADSWQKWWPVSAETFIILYQVCISQFEFLAIPLYHIPSSFLQLSANLLLFTDSVKSDSWLLSQYKYFHTIKGCLWAGETNIWGEREEERRGMGSGPKEGKIVQNCPTVLGVEGHNPTLFCRMLGRPLSAPSPHT